MAKLNLSITTIGRRSGDDRTVPLYGFEDGDGIIIVASRGGSPVDPAWAQNLRADPHLTVHSRGDSRPMRAREVFDAERERLWAIAAEGFPLYLTYARKTTRRIPVFRLEPIPPA